MLARCTHCTVLKECQNKLIPMASSGAGYIYSLHSYSYIALFTFWIEVSFFLNLQWVTFKLVITIMVWNKIHTDGIIIHGTFICFSINTKWY